MSRPLRLPKNTCGGKLVDMSFPQLLIGIGLVAVGTTLYNAMRRRYRQLHEYLEQASPVPLEIVHMKKVGRGVNAAPSYWVEVNPSDQPPATLQVPKSVYDSYRKRDTIDLYEYPGSSRLVHPEFPGGRIGSLGSLGRVVGLIGVVVIFISFA